MLAARSSQDRDERQPAQMVTSVRSLALTQQGANLKINQAQAAEKGKKAVIYPC